MKILSDSEVHFPKQYSKKSINKYDGFSRIYFNENPNKKSNASLVNHKIYKKAKRNNHEQISFSNSRINDHIIDINNVIKGDFDLSNQLSHEKIEFDDILNTLT